MGTAPFNAYSSQIRFDTLANMPATSAAGLRVGDRYIATDEGNNIYTLHLDPNGSAGQRLWMAPGDVVLVSDAAITAFMGVSAVGASADGRVAPAAQEGGECCGVAQNTVTGAGLSVVVRTAGYTRLLVGAAVTRGLSLGIHATDGLFKLASLLVQATGAASMSHAYALETTGGAATIRAVIALSGIVPTSFA